MLLFLVAFVVFRASPRGQLYDSRYALLVSHLLVSEGDPRLDDFVDALGGVTESGQPRDYRIVAVDGAYHWFYPAGTPLLAAPFVAAADAAGVGPVDAGGRYDRGAERRLQRWLSAGAMAIAGLLFFGIARALLPLGPSVWVAVAALFGSPVWSTASRSLWSQSPTVLLTAGAVLLLVRGVQREASIRPVAVASLLAWAWMCRPTAALPALAVTVWVATCRRASLPALIATACVWLALFVGFHVLAYGGLLPPYHALDSHVFELIPEALVGNWISPARGLLVYCPIVIAVLWGTARHWPALPHRSLALLAIVIITLHWLLVSSHAPWWGGYGYGARLMTETVPWLVLLGVVAWSGTRAAGEALGRGSTIVLATLLGLSVLMNGVGAISRSAADWNHRQSEPNFERQLWSLRDAPFLAPLRHSPER